MADLIRRAPLVKIATVKLSDLDQMRGCLGLRFSDDGSPYQQRAGKERRELEVMGWFRKKDKHYLLVQRVDDGSLFTHYLDHIQAWAAIGRYPQLFLR